MTHPHIAFAEIFSRLDEPKSDIVEVLAKAANLRGERIGYSEPFSRYSLSHGQRLCTNRDVAGLGLNWLETVELSPIQKR
ncbi:hypothetical protein BH23ACT5_BH23ACT5_01820 [soil metagenome]